MRERRRALRIEHQAGMVFALQKQYEYRNGLIKNTNIYGLYFTGSDPLPPGALVTIKMLNYCCVIEASVIWCAPSGGPGGLFGAGVCFCEPLTPGLV